MMKIKSIFTSALAVLLMVCFVPLYFGCDSSKQYENFAQNYASFVQTNADIFDEYGAVRIKYNDDVESVINNNSGATVEEKLRKFPRLSRISTSNQAVYETIFKACMLYVGSYINRAADYSISDKDANKLNNQLSDLEKAINHFKQQKTYVDEYGESLSTTSQTEYNNLEPLLNALYDVVVKSSEFANTFADVYEKKIADSKEKTTLVDVERFYLKSMVRMSSVYTQVYLPLIHNSTPAKSLKNPDSEELYTEYAFSDLVNKILRVYTLNQAKIHNLTTKSGNYTTAELATLSYFNYILEYETVCEKSQKVMLSIVDEWEPVFKKKVQIDFSNTNPLKNQTLSTKEQSYLDIMDVCYNDCVQIQNMLTLLANNI